jgi:hypothetical protein
MRLKFRETHLYVANFTWNERLLIFSVAKFFMFDLILFDDLVLAVATLVSFFNLVLFVYQMILVVDFCRMRLPVEP